MRALRELRDVMRTSDPYMVELLAFLFTTAMGVWLLLPSDTFVREGDYYPIYDLVRAALGTEEQAGIAWLMTGLGIGWALTYDRGWLLRGLLSLAATMLWVLMLVSIASLYPEGTATPTYSVMVFGHAWVAHRYLVTERRTIRRLRDEH